MTMHQNSISWLVDFPVFIQLRAALGKHSSPAPTHVLICTWPLKCERHLLTLKPAGSPRAWSLCSAAVHRAIFDKVPSKDARPSTALIPNVGTAAEALTGLPTEIYMRLQDTRYFVQAALPMHFMAFRPPGTLLVDASGWHARTFSQLHSQTSGGGAAQKASSTSSTIFPKPDSHTKMNRFTTWPPKQNAATARRSQLRETSKTDFQISRWCRPDQETQEVL